MIIDAFKHTAHYSVDDVWKSFRWLSAHCPDSLFDMRFFGTLREFHKKYNARFTLYCIVKMDGCCISDIPQKYENDFASSSDWLRFGFHSATDKAFRQSLDFDEAYAIFQETAARLQMGTTSTLRLHSWTVRDEQLNLLREKGIKVIMYPDWDEFFYDENGIFIRNGIAFSRTDIWLEKTGQLNKEILRTEKRTCNVFTHEWCFDEQKDKMELALKTHWENGFVFI